MLNREEVLMILNHKWDRFEVAQVNYNFLIKSDYKFGGNMSSEDINNYVLDNYGRDVLEPEEFKKYQEKNTVKVKRR